MNSLKTNSLPVLIGSLPVEDHQHAVEMIFGYTPQIPLWPQLPKYKAEGMLHQFLPGFPGASAGNDKIFIDGESPQFETDFLAFFEEYLMIDEGGAELDESRFSMAGDEAKGFNTFLNFAADYRDQLTALKGQITGPITFCTGLVDQSGRAIFYNEQLREAAIKHLAFKAKWQARKMASIKAQPLLFFDEPGLAGFGSSAFITITPEDVKACLTEVFAAVKTEGALSGVHVCANTEWSLIFDSGVDVVSFDAYSYFDKFVLYPDHIRRFFEQGGILASGIVPTSVEFIEQEDVESLTNLWLQQSHQLEEIGIDKRTIYEQSLITPSCGTGTLSEEMAVRVMELTRDVSAAIRCQYL
ncbi:MAG: hypothetical protein D6B25_17585 [Desulfobulbaceae bacterium]|nr:MAG: hypothetical protein D6B25_17585 [Desulfobulbaceae bacterium]